MNMKVYSIQEIVELIGVSDSTIRRAIQNGKLKAGKKSSPKGIKYQITQEALNEWLNTRNYTTYPKKHTLKHNVQNLLTLIQKLENEKELLHHQIKKLENQLKKQEEEMTARLEAKERSFQQFIANWRETAALTETEIEKEKPWWKFWNRE